jgi:hypothetical protein
LSRRGIINNSPLSAKYDNAIDRESAYEILQKKALQDQERLLKEQELAKKEKEIKKSAGRPKASLVQKAANSAVTAIGRELGRSIFRGLLGSLKR